MTDDELESEIKTMSLQLKEIDNELEILYLQLEEAAKKDEETTRKIRQSGVLITTLRTTKPALEISRLGKEKRQLEAKIKARQDMLEENKNS